MEMSHFVSPSPLYSPSLCLRMLGYRMFGIPVGDGDGWTPLFARAFNDWEIEVVEHFLHKIQAFRVQREEKDRVFWTASKCGTFSVKSLYSILKLEGSFLFPSDGIWRVRVPPKAAFFAWEASYVKS